jgi:hypothetical protein
MPKENTKLDGNERLLIELNLSVKYLTDAFEKFEKAFSDRLTSIEHQKVDRTEVNRLLTDSLNTHTNLEGRIKTVEDCVEQMQKEAATLGGQIRLASWLIGTGILLLGIVAPILTALYIK